MLDTTVHHIPQEYSTFLNLFLNNKEWRHKYKAECLAAWLIVSCFSISILSWFSYNYFVAHHGVTQCRRFRLTLKLSRLFWHKFWNVSETWYNPEANESCETGYWGNVRFFITCSFYVLVEGITFNLPLLSVVYNLLKKFRNIWQQIWFKCLAWEASYRIKI